MSVSVAIAVVLLGLALLALGFASAKARSLVREWHAALLVLGLWLLVEADARTFDPFAFTIVCVLAVSSVLALRQVEKGKPGLTAVDLVVWLVLFVPLDLRWSYTLWPKHHEGAYAFWAVAVAYLAALGWGGERALPSLGHRPPVLRDLGVGFAALLGFGAIAIPVGLATGFLHRPSAQHFDVGRSLLEAVGIVITVALPEEIFFRGVLDGGLKPLFKSPWASLAISSLAFGLMHWPRSDDLRERLIYASLAAVAGVFYGLAFRVGRGLPAAVLCHTAVDWVWHEFLSKR
jgi:membrane protease YdiL (CAAX protease family)